MDMLFQSLTAIADRDESLAAFRLLEASLRKEARVFPDHLVGWQGGSRRHTVYWLPNFDVWAVLELSPSGIKKEPGHRFWNCFGIGDPAERQMLAITVEINPPHEGEDGRVAGLFARDEVGRIYLAHTGRVGGGRKGIGPKAFRKFLGDDRWHEVGTRRGGRMAIVLGPIDDQGFSNQLADFVHNVAHFKNSVVMRPSP